MDSDPALLPIERLAPLLARKRLSPVELLGAVLARIARLNPSLNAYLTVTEEEARKEARRAEREIGRGRYRGPLHGIPLALKDNLWTRGVRTTAGSKILSAFLPAEDATIVRRLRRAGAVLLGKTNLHEFAYGVTTNNAHYGPTRNPWDPERIPGGSTGGSAAAIASGMCIASVGTDTGGSIRIPAALCGIVGLKPTYGRVSCHGIVPLARSLDHAGPLARTVTDAAYLLRAVAGRDSQDPATWGCPPLADIEAPPGSLRKRRLGWPREYFFDRLDADVSRALDEARQVFEGLGATVAEVSLPHIGESTEASLSIAYAEATHAHQSAGWYPRRSDEYSDETRKLLEAGREVRAADYLRARELQQVVRSDFEAAFKSVDVLLAPSVPMAAPRIGEDRVVLGGETETVRAALIRLNRPGNFTGMPAISVPCGFAKSGLPLGLQLIGRRFDEAGVLRIAGAFERASEWHRQRPAGI